MKIVIHERLAAAKDAPPREPEIHSSTTPGAELMLCLVYVGIPLLALVGLGLTFFFWAQQ